MKPGRARLYVTVERGGRRGSIIVRDDRGLRLGGIISATLRTARGDAGVLYLEIAESALAGVFLGAPNDDPTDYNDHGFLWR